MRIGHPAGEIFVRATVQEIEIESPIEIELNVFGTSETLPAGRHTVTA